MSRRLSISLRRGLSLLEVILAIAIFGMSLAIIGELVRIGNRSAAAARDLSDAQRLASNILNEIAAGITPPAAVSGEVCPEDESWLYSVTVAETDVAGLLAVTVTVEQDPEMASRPVSFSLVRWVADPAALPTEESTSESSTTGSAAGTGGSNAR
jgi:type II secretion system protein I